jgi:DNA polymerase V
MEEMWIPGFQWTRAGVYLADLSSSEVTQPGLPGLGPAEPVQRRKLMEVMDALNAEHGKDAVRLASTGLERTWKPKAERLTKLTDKDATVEGVKSEGDSRVKRTRIRFHE